jgi:hypothetical protein
MLHMRDVYVGATTPKETSVMIEPAYIKIPINPILAEEPPDPQATKDHLPYLHYPISISPEVVEPYQILFTVPTR